MYNPAFLVDGFTEKLILARICPGSVVNRIDCNGNSVSIGVMTKRIASLIRLMNNRYYPIIILIDREERDLTIYQIQEQIRIELENLGIKDDIRIGICDRMIENWMLADWDSFINICKNETIQRPEVIEGVKGKGLIKKVYPTYQETTDGVNLFLQSSPVTMYNNSASFKMFLDQITDIECEWLQVLF